MANAWTRAPALETRIADSSPRQTTLRIPKPSNPDEETQKLLDVMYSTPGNKDYTDLSECKDCGLWLSHAERLNFESLKNQKNVSYVSVTLSIIAIIISVIALYIKK